MGSRFVGEVAALVTALCWAFTGVFFTFSGRRVGSQVVNLSRLLLALLIMLGIHRVLEGQWLPLGAGAARWSWLSLSGIVGLALGDAALFQAMIFLGARLAMLMMALVPIITTIIAWVFLRERLSPLDLSAVALTVAGVGWVVLERGRGEALAPEAANYRWGLVFGLGAALGQAVGLILSREGLVGGFSVVSANLIRILAACAALWGVAALTGQGRQAVDAVRADRRAALAILGGTLVGPVIGVLCSLVAVQLAPVGIASTLMALTPVLILPLVVFAEHERLSPRAVAGTLLALAGVALIFRA